MRVIWVIVLLLRLASPALAFAGQSEPRFTTLVVEYVGVMDRPVSPVVISTSLEEGEWYKQHLFREQLRFLVQVNVVPATTLNEITELPLLKHTLGSAKSSDEKPRTPQNVRFTAGIGHDRVQIIVDAQTSAKILKDIAGVVAKHPTLKSELQEIELMSISKDQSAD